jgi:hypothetical protein
MMLRRARQLSPQQQQAVELRLRLQALLWLHPLCMMQQQQGWVQSRVTAAAAPGI